MACASSHLVALSTIVSLSSTSASHDTLSRSSAAMASAVVQMRSFPSSSLRSSPSTEISGTVCRTASIWNVTGQSPPRPPATSLCSWAQRASAMPSVQSKYLAAKRGTEPTQARESRVSDIYTVTRGALGLEMGCW